MKLIPLIISALAIGSILGSTPLALAGEHTNLKVLIDNGGDLEKGMKMMTKGLGVKCEACHVKGKFESDEVSTKIEARKFLAASLANPKDRDAALASLLAALAIERPKEVDKVWEGIAMLKKK